MWTVRLESAGPSYGQLPSLRRPPRGRLACRVPRVSGLRAAPRRDLHGRRRHARRAALIAIWNLLVYSWKHGADALAAGLSSPATDAMSPASLELIKRAPSASTAAFLPGLVEKTITLLPCARRARGHGSRILTRRRMHMRGMCVGCLNVV